MRTKLTPVALILACVLAGAVVAQTDPFKVYCVDGKIRVDQRTFLEMKKAFSPSVCAFGEFETASQANAYAQKFGSEGAKCSCR